MSEWQPINTAPKNGEKIILRCSKSRISCTATWSGRFNEFVNDYGGSVGEWKYDEWSPL